MNWKSYTYLTVLRNFSIPDFTNKIINSSENNEYIYFVLFGWFFLPYLNLARSLNNKLRRIKLLNLNTQEEVFHFF